MTRCTNAAFVIDDATLAFQLPLWSSECEEKERRAIPMSVSRENQARGHKMIKLGFNVGRSSVVFTCFKTENWRCRTVALVGMLSEIPRSPVD